MGFSDHLPCDVEVPGLGLDPTRPFRAKLYCCGAELQISRGGRLLRQLHRDAVVGEIEIRGFRLPRYERTVLGGEDLNYHGDLYFITHLPDGGWADFAARFTDGSLDRIRRFESLTDTHRLLLHARE